MSTEEDNKNQTPSIEFTYFKTEPLSIMKVDGIYGGLTPRGDVVMSIFTERVPIPNTEKYAITPDGKLGGMVERQIDTQSIVRQVEAVLSMRPDIARSMAKWLNEKVDAFEQALKEEESGGANDVH